MNSLARCPSWTESAPLHEEALVAYRGLVCECRTSLMLDVSNGPSYDQLVRYIGQGKMLRALLVFMATSAVGGDPLSAMCGARAIELLHAAALVHDDIIDSAVERRGFPALHLQLGLERALIVGDYLILRSFNVVTAESVRDGLTSLRVLGMLGHYAEECCRGQVRELDQYDEADLEHWYLATAKSKTGSTLAAAAGIGATLGGGSDREISALSEYGAHLGTAFQIEDDLADLIDDSHSVAKSSTASLVAARRSLPLIYFERNSSKTSREELRSIIADGHDTKSVISLLEREGVLRAVRSTQNYMLELALTALEEVRGKNGLHELRAFPSYVLNALSARDGANLVSS